MRFEGTEEWNKQAKPSGEDEIRSITTLFFIYKNWVYETLKDEQLRNAFVDGEVLNNNLWWWIIFHIHYVSVEDGVFSMVRDVQHLKALLLHRMNFEYSWEADTHNTVCLKYKAFNSRRHYSF